MPVAWLRRGNYKYFAYPLPTWWRCCGLRFIRRSLNATAG